MGMSGSPVILHLVRFHLSSEMSLHQGACPWRVFYTQGCVAAALKLRREPSCSWEAAALLPLRTQGATAVRGRAVLGAVGSKETWLSVSPARARGWPWVTRSECSVAPAVSTNARSQWCFLLGKGVSAFTTSAYRAGTALGMDSDTFIFSKPACPFHGGTVHTRAPSASPFTVR